MRRLRPVIAIGAIILMAALVWFFLLRDGEARTLTGYIEGERIYLAAPVSGSVAALYVREGQRVAADARRAGVPEPERPGSRRGRVHRRRQCRPSKASASTMIPGAS